MGMKVTVPVRNAANALVLKEQVEESYLDFTWRYTPQVNNWLGDEI
jgi:hypothetical protein